MDIYDAAGIKKPDLSILSEKCMQDVRQRPHKNIALEVLRKLLVDELHNRGRTNLGQSKKLLERLEAALRRYHNKALSAADVLEELICLSKDVRDADTQAQELGLTDYEYAFYLAVADNDSARQLMQQEKLRELAVVLTQKVCENTTLDWTIKSSARAKIRAIVKRILKRYGYPPDMAELATDTVLKQAELIAGELAQ